MQVRDAIQKPRKLPYTNTKGVVPIQHLCECCRWKWQRRQGGSISSLSILYRNSLAQGGPPRLHYQLFYTCMSDISSKKRKVQAHGRYEPVVALSMMSTEMPSYVRGWSNCFRGRITKTYETNLLYVGGCERRSSSNHTTGWPLQWQTLNPWGQVVHRRVPSCS